MTPQPLPPTSQAVSLQGVRILIVDDEPDTRALLEEWFACFGSRTAAAPDGFEAVKLMKTQPFDLVITDLKMPGISGLQLLGILKELDPAVEVIFLSGNATMEDAITALREGNAFDFMQKPLRSLTQLNDVLSRALARRRRRQAMGRLFGPHGPSTAPAHLEPLSAREAEILALLVQGLDNRAIGEQLHNSEKTVKNHLTRIYEKLKVKNRTQAIAVCHQYNLL